MAFVSWCRQRGWRTVSTVWLVLCAVCPGTADELRPTLSHERIILRTVVGDLVLALYPEVAPLHVAQILRLVRHSVYDTTHVYSVRPHFLAQLSTAYDRQQPLSPEQQALIRPLPAEFNASVRHRKGVLSMARQPDDPHSAETSFFIFLERVKKVPDCSDAARFPEPFFEENQRI